MVVSKIVSLLFIVIIFGSLFLVFKMTSKIRTNYSANDIGKVVATFPVGYKNNGYIVKIIDKYYFCCENCGAIELTDYDNKLEESLDSISFQKMVSDELAQVKNSNIASLIDKYKK